MTVATAFKPEARRNRLVQLLRSYPLLSYFVLTLGIVMVPGAVASFGAPSLAEWLVVPGFLVFGGPLFKEPGCEASPSRACKHAGDRC